MWATPQKKGFPPRGMGGVPGVSSAAAAGALSAAGGAFPSTYSAALAAAMGMPGPSQAHGTTSEHQQEAIRKQHEALVRAAELKQMLSGLERVDDDDRRSSLLDTLCPVVDILNLPLHPNPPGIANGELVVDLLKHQVTYSLWSCSCTLTRM